MTGCMAAAAQFLGNFSGGQIQLRGQTVQNAALSHAGVSGKGHQFSGNGLPQLIHALTGFRTGADDSKTCMFIDADQIHCRIQIAFIDTEHYRHILVTGNGRYPVNQVRFRYRIYIGSKHNQRVNIGYRRPDKFILPGQDLFYHTLSPFHGDFHQISG